ncbi:hypothetical protein PACILC2_35520 [Paenibacillus cisolokensis]|uniref:Histidine kinase n=1 Tax=Paenibacillus cisolokensis TaxID=1658519 RepID=A0ABQ4NAK4_9BACL|nr:hypothetical protein [Paenibacillus cisolokensis]GIQ64984.1 hypothetical protein PACILC2_35520 [Paenibacillus cisolokensis]
MMRAIRRPLPILAQLWAGMFLIAVLVIALTIFSITVSIRRRC